MTLQTRPQSVSILVALATSWTRMGNYEAARRRIVNKITRVRLELRVLSTRRRRNWKPQGCPE